MISPLPGEPIHFTDGNDLECLQRAGVGQYVSKELEDHLIKLCLTWENPFIHVVDDSVFMRARQQASVGPVGDRQTSVYSEVLVNAM